MCGQTTSSRAAFLSGGKLWSYNYFISLVNQTLQIFSALLFYLSYGRMAAAPHVMVWVKLEDGVLQRASTSLQVSKKACVNNVVDAALLEMKPDQDPTLVAATLKGEELERDRLVSSLTTSRDEPIILTVNRAHGQGVW